MVGPFLFFYGTLPAFLPPQFPAALPNPLSRITARVQRVRNVDPDVFSRALWVLGFLALLAVFSDPALRPLVDATLWHSKRAYGCSQAVFPPRLINVRTDDVAPCGAGSGGGWSIYALTLDVAGVFLSTIAILGVAAVMPRQRTVLTEAGERTLSVYVFHLYILPAVEVPFTALVQVTAYFVHPEVAAAVTFGGCLILVHALAWPVPSLERTLGYVVGQQARCLDSAVFRHPLSYGRLKAMMRTPWAATHPAPDEVEPLVGVTRAPV